MDHHQVRALLKDPGRREEAMKIIEENTHVIQDEFGKTFTAVKLGEISISRNILINTADSVLTDSRDEPLRPSDILVLTLPKTGTHWFNNLLYHLIQNGPLEDVVSMSPHFLEIRGGEDFETLPNPRILTSHMIPSLGPQQIFNDKRIKVFIVCRNPKDVAVSMYHFHLKDKIAKGPIQISWNCYLKSWIDGLAPMFSYFRYYELWNKSIKENANLDILIVHYEDLQENGLRELQRMQKHIGLQHSDERLRQVLEKCQLNNLKADEIKDKKEITTQVDDEGKLLQYRKGIVGDWKNLFTVAQSEQMDELIEKHIKHTVFYRK